MLNNPEIRWARLGSARARLGVNTPRGCRAAAGVTWKQVWSHPAQPLVRLKINSKLGWPDHFLMNKHCVLLKPQII